MNFYHTTVDGLHSRYSIILTSLPTVNELLLWAAEILIEKEDIGRVSGKAALHNNKVFSRKDSISISFSTERNRLFNFHAASSKIDLEDVKTLESYLTHAEPVIRRLAKQRMEIPE